VRRSQPPVLCGKQAIDGDNRRSVPSWPSTGLPFVGFVRRVREAGHGRVVVERMTEEGADVVESPLPAVLSVVKEINTPRLPSLKGKMRARTFKPVTWNAAALEADEARLGFAGSPTKVVKVFHPEPRRGGEMIAGNPAEAAERLAERLRALGACR
jgi:electron transfer flavoprotein beta subunit